MEVVVKYIVKIKMLINNKDGFDVTSIFLFFRLSSTRFESFRFYIYHFHSYMYIPK